MGSVRRTIGATLAALAVWPAVAAAAEDRLPIFDAHLHYSKSAWAAHPPAAVVRALEAAGVPRALVSSTPDDGTLALHRADPGRFVPILRPYRTRADMGGWFGDPEVLAYVEKRLARGLHKGIGEFHLFDEAAAGTPQMRRLVALAAARGLVLHVHSGAAPVRALAAHDPKVRILWAHAGLSEPPAVVGAILDRHQRVMAELSFRARDIAPGGRITPAWRALLLRHARRFVIGSDTYVPPRWDGYGAIIDAHRRWLGQLPREVGEAIAWRNAAREFGAGRLAGAGG